MSCTSTIQLLLVGTAWGVRYRRPPLQSAVGVQGRRAAFKLPSAELHNKLEVLVRVAGFDISLDLHGTVVLWLVVIVPGQQFTGRSFGGRIRAANGSSRRHFPLPALNCGIALHAQIPGTAEDREALAQPRIPISTGSQVLQMPPVAAPI